MKQLWIDISAALYLIVLLIEGKIHDWKLKRRLEAKKQGLEGARR